MPTPPGGVVLGLAIAAGWLATGAVGVALMRARGHDTFSWALLFMFLGPIAVPLAISSDRHRPTAPPRPLPPGELDVLVSHDGTPDAQAAMETALTLLGQQMTSMTLAAVVDLEAPSTVRGRDTQREAQERLDALARELATVTSAPVATVILFGEPATALQHFALENGYELIVAGSVAARSHMGGRRAVATGPQVPDVARIADALRPPYVAYLVVGGIAARAHGARRLTDDFRHERGDVDRLARSGLARASPGAYS